MAEKIELEDNRQFDIELVNGEPLLDGKKHKFKIEQLNSRKFLFSMDNHIYNVEILEKIGSRIVLKINGKEIVAIYKSQVSQMLESLGMSDYYQEKINKLKAPMPGTILEILCTPGDEIKKGDSLLILEAMKMENVIKSPGDGIVDELHVRKEENVDKNQALITFK